MKITQISVFMENRSGRLARITTTLGNSGINIRAMSLADTSDFGILRLIVSDIEKAHRVLKQQGFLVRTAEVVAIAIPDVPGALGNLLSLMEHADLNVEYMYAFVEKAHDQAILIFRFDDMDRAIDVMLENDINVLEARKVLSM
ncbi:MAG: ACT domain-containing protein [Desulfobacteraceae bacterium]|nr:ACT domain-containing protein [Desulfobacteraceae bacterium]